MPRLFAGIEVPRHISLRLSILRAGLSGARWIEPEHYHITLRFAGDIDGAQAGDFADALADIEAERFEAELDTLGSFGGRKPRALWAGVKPAEALMRLQKLTERAARQAGLEPEAQNYAPHITLARLRYASPIDVADYLSRLGAAPGASFPVTRFALFSARSHHGGGPYLVEETYPLGAGGDEEE